MSSNMKCNVFYDYSDPSDGRHGLRQWEWREEWSFDDVFAGIVQFEQKYVNSTYVFIDHLTQTVYAFPDRENGKGNFQDDIVYPLGYEFVVDPLVHEKFLKTDRTCDCVDCHLNDTVRERMEAQSFKIEKQSVSFCPRYKESLPVKYILVETCYNNRALASEKSGYIKEFLEILDGTIDVTDGAECFPDNSTGISEHPEVKIIKNEPHSRLLYTCHRGYTWIDDDKDYPVYANGHSIEEIGNVRKHLTDNGIDDRGCFVFEVNGGNSVTPLKIQNVIFHLTEMNFCGFFCPNTLCDVKYYPSVNAIVYTFDTESG